MQSLVLPGPTSLLTTPFGRPSEPEDGLAKFRSKFSPNRSEHQGYPSPPMSESHSPSRRTAQLESARLSYPPPGSSQRQDSLTQPPTLPSLYDPRSTSGAHALPLQRPLYPGEPQHRGQALHYQPGRAHEHQSYPHAIPHNYGYGYQNAGLPPYAGVQHGGPMVQQGAMIAPPPSRPTKPARRTKAHVASACVNCKKAHLSCDVQRPCGRCVASGKQDTCKDVQHKKRGRPRLRDDREFTRSDDGRPPSQLVGAPPTSEPHAHQAPYPVSQQYRPFEPQRSLESTAHQKELHSAASAPRDAPNSVGDYSGVQAPPYGVGPNLAYQKLPVVYLNLDLVIQKANQAFADLVSFLGDIRGKHLGELLEARQNESMQKLRNDLRDERDEREPTYMAPITPVGQDPMRAVMESVQDQDIDHVTQGYTNRPMYLSFRLPASGQYQSLSVQIRLARTSLYFVTLVVCSPPRHAGPTLLTQQLAPSTSRHTSQAMSAPTAVSQFTPHQERRTSTTSSGPNSPFINISSIRTSLPTFSPSSYKSSPSYGYSPTAGPESGYFPTYQVPPQPTSSAYPSPYAQPARPPAATSEPLRELNRPPRLEGLHLPPIRTGPAPLGSPLHVETSAAERERVRTHDSPSSSAEQRRPESPDMGKRRRLNIHEVLD